MFNYHQYIPIPISLPGTHPQDGENCKSRLHRKSRKDDSSLQKIMEGSVGDSKGIKDIALNPKLILLKCMVLTWMQKPKKKMNIDEARKLFKNFFHRWNLSVNIQILCR